VIQKKSSPNPPSCPSFTPQTESTNPPPGQDRAGKHGADRSALSNAVKHLGCYSPPPLKESRPEIQSERLLRVEQHVTPVHISDNHKTAPSKDECLTVLFL
jgi:hypothetical protein